MYETSFVCKKTYETPPVHKGFPGDSAVKNVPANAGGAGDVDLIPRSGRSPGEGNGYPLRYSCLGNPWTAEPSRLVQRVTKSWTRLIDGTHTHCAQVLGLEAEPQRPKKLRSRKSKGASPESAC